jgi:hypothetical protein
LQIKTKFVSCHTADSKPVKQEVNGTVILPPLVFPAFSQQPFLFSFPISRSPATADQTQSNRQSMHAGQDCETFLPPSTTTTATTAAAPNAACSACNGGPNVMTCTAVIEQPTQVVIF